MGTPLNCAIVSEFAVYETSEIPGLELIEDEIIWRRSERQSILRQLVNTDLDLDKMVDAKGQRTAISIALALEIMHDDPFIVFTLIDAGAKISAKDFGHLYTGLHYISEGYGPKSNDIVPFCGITMPFLIKAATEQNRALVQGAEFEFFSFSLEVLSCGWSLEYLHPFFEVRFSEMFAAFGGFELDEIIRDESIDPQSRLVKLLSTAIRNSAPTEDMANSRLLDSLNSALCHQNPSIMALLFQYNTELSASGLTPRTYSKENCLHLVLRDWSLAGEKEAVLRLLISKGASVTNPDHEGITAIELVAGTYDLDIFQMMWDSAMSSMAFGRSPKLLKRILCSAIKYENKPILKFLVWKLQESKLMPHSSMLELAVGQKTSSLLELILEHEHEFICHPTDGCISKGKLEEESGEHCAKVLGCSWDHDEQCIELDFDMRAERMFCRNQALYSAAKPGGSFINFTFLVALGLPASHDNQNGHAILHILTANRDENSFSKLQYLLNSSGPKLDLLNSNHLTPLALAVRSRNIRRMERLLDAGADLNTLLVDNQTALHIACYSGKKAAAEALLKRGCHTSQQNLQGQTPMDFALACGYQEIATTIQNFIDYKLTCNGPHTCHPSVERLSTVATSNFTQTEDQGSLPFE